MNQLASILLICSLFILSPAALAEQPSAGKVLLSVGNNQAVSAEGETRRLKRKGEIFPGDRIKTGKGGRVQIRFSDGSLLSLKPDTVFLVEAYQYRSEDGAQNKAVYHLLKGGMRTITGLIGKEDKQQYRVETPVATIGIRGTDYNLHFCDALCSAQTQHPQGLFGGVSQGGITLSNEAGQFDQGPDEFFFVAKATSALQPLLAPPALILQDQSASPDEQPDEQPDERPDERTSGQPEQASSDEPSSSDEQGDNPVEESAKDGATAPEKSASGEQAAATQQDNRDLETADTTQPVSDTSETSTTTHSQTVNDGSKQLPGDTAFAELQSGMVQDEVTLLEGFGQDIGDTLIDGSNQLLGGGEETITLLPTIDPEINQISDTSTQSTTSPPATDPVTAGTPAPAGSVLGLSFVRMDPTEGPVTGSALLLVADSNSLTLDQIAGNDNVPVSFLVQDPANEPGQPLCNPCTFSAGSALLTDVGGLNDTGMAINWGRWQKGWSLTVSGTPEPTQDDLHFIYSADLTSPLNVQSLTGSFRYDFLGGTQPSDEANLLGVYLPSSNFLEIDFTNQMLIASALAVDVGGKNVSASQLHTLVPIDLLLQGHPILLKGDCFGGSCGTSGVPLIGDMSFDLVGSGGERLILSWGLFEDMLPSAVAVNGVAAFGQGSPLPASTFSFSPPGTILSLSYVGFGDLGDAKALHRQLRADVDTAVVTDTVGMIGNVPIYTAFDETDPNSPCTPCEISAGQASLTDTGGLAGAGTGVNWGRWDGDWAATGDGPNAMMPGASLHYIYSPNRTPDSVVQSLTGSFSYPLVGGTQPTDEFGFTGTYVGSNQIDVDFSAQTLTSLQLNLLINGRNISAGQAGITPLSDLLNAVPVSLNGLCTGSDCGPGVVMNGQMGLDFIGPNAERLIGTFGLTENAPNPGIAVTGAAAYER